jgi:peptide/nickel transport system substrate-binding protein
MKAVKVDDFTVDFVLSRPNPILNAEWDTWYMFSRKWSQAVGATQAQSPKATALAAWALQANGTGPFMVVGHEPGVKTQFKKNPNWWRTPEHNLDEVIFTTIKSDATRVAALLSGDVDLIEPVPVQDMQRIARDPATKVMTGPELRTIFLNLDSFRDELLYSNVKGRNPFKDARVRKAIYQAIDIEAIKSKVMRGQATPSAVLISPLLFSRSAEIDRYPFDIAAAKQLMAQAGYPQGFVVRLDCPNDRYVNDDEICTAIAAMLARIDIKVTVNAQPKARFFDFAGSSGKYDSSFNMLGWTPGSFDSHNVLTNVVGCRDADGHGGLFNYGGYCNQQVEVLAAAIAVEIDRQKRDDLILQAFKIVHEEAGIIPLHQQALAWGVSRSVEIHQRADNQILFYWARKN